MEGKRVDEAWVIGSFAGCLSYMLEDRSSLLRQGSEEWFPCEPDDMM